jgi:hypothetical protein
MVDRVEPARLLPPQLVGDDQRRESRAELENPAWPDERDELAKEPTRIEAQRPPAGMSAPDDVVVRRVLDRLEIDHVRSCRHHGKVTFMTSPNRPSPAAP